MLIFQFGTRIFAKPLSDPRSTVLNSKTSIMQILRLVGFGTLTEMTCADSVIDVGRDATEVFEHKIKRLPRFNGDQRLQNWTRSRCVQMLAKSPASS